MKQYKLNLIKTKETYTYQEICDLFKICRDTVKSWVRQGLTPINPDHNPKLIYGHDLKGFLKEKLQNRKHPLKSGESYCMKCRKGVLPALGSTQDIVKNRIGKGKRLLVKKGTCPYCGITVFRYGSQVDMSCLGVSNYEKKDRSYDDLPLFKCS